MQTRCFITCDICTSLISSTAKQSQIILFTHYRQMRKEGIESIQVKTTQNSRTLLQLLHYMPFNYKKDQDCEHLKIRSITHK